MRFSRSPVLVVILLFAVSCNQMVNGVFKVKKPGAIPNIFHEGTDLAFSRVQDTIFYKGEVFSGFVYDLFPSGDTSAKVSYLNGLCEGITRKWYLNKQLSEERLYINGRKEGVHKGWWESGKPKFVFDVSNDEYTGEFKEWFVAGNICRDFHYKNGQEEGHEKMWWPDGTIRANYVIKDGQKFGLFGQRLCANSVLKDAVK